MNSEDSDHITNANAIIAIAREAEANKKPAPLALSGQALLKPDGTIISLEKYHEAPWRKRAIVSTYETASFIDYVNRHKLTGQTHLFGQATELGGSFSAMLDYHGIVGGESGHVGPYNGPGWGDHQITLSLSSSPEWVRWVKLNGTYVSQEQFAEFIEDNMSDIIQPDAATVLEMAQGLQGKKTVQFKSGKNLKDGAIKLEYVEAIEVTGSSTRRDDSLQVPSRFTLALVPFVGAAGVEITARLRFRIGNNGALSFAYILDRPYKVIEVAFEHARTAIEEATGIKVILGNGRIPGVS